MALNKHKLNANAIQNFFINTFVIHKQNYNLFIKLKF